MKDKCIIFDMDGTLIDSSRAMTQSVNFVREHIGLPPIEQKMLEYYINQPDQHLSKIFYNTEVYDPAHRALFSKHYLQSTSEIISLYPDVNEMLNYLSHKAFLSIATNASDFFARHMLQELDIMKHFSAVIGANNVSEPKPSPLMLHHIMKEAQCSLSHTILIGDSIKDERAALNAGIDFVFANWGYGTSDTANLKVNNIHELIALLNTFI